MDGAKGRSVVDLNRVEGQLVNDLFVFIMVPQRRDKWNPYFNETEHRFSCPRFFMYIRYPFNV